MTRGPRVHGATRRARRRSQWLSAAAGDCSLRLTDQPCVEFTPMLADLFSFVDNPQSAVPGQVESVGEVTLIRLVGELVLMDFHVAAAPNAATALIVHHYMGIYISDEALDGTVLNKDPATADDQSSKDWLWRSTWCSHSFIPGNAAYAESFSNQGEPSAHIDVKVKRKIRQEETIVLAITTLHEQLVGDRLSATSQLVGNVRALVLLP